MNCIRLKMWKNDLKILGNALIKSLKNLFAVKIKRVSSNTKLFPLHMKQKNESLPISIKSSEYLYYGQNTRNQAVVLLRYTRLPVLS